MKIILLSDTHGLHSQISELPPADLIICAGDITNLGYPEEISDFCQWYNQLNCKSKIFIPGNHDFDFQLNSEKTNELVKKYKSISCLIDETYTHDEITLYGSPWSPLPIGWAYSQLRDSNNFQKKWDKIPENINILITHAPAYGILDSSENKDEKYGCKLLLEKIKKIKPQIHICGHIHTGNGYFFDGNTHFFNASIVNEQTEIIKKPFIIDWCPLTNKITFL